MRLTAVIAIYQIDVLQSNTIQSILQVEEPSVSRFLKENVDFLIYDNSPEKHEIKELQTSGYHFHYLHDARNLGLSVAYDAGLTRALMNNSEYLWLMDQDSKFSEDYFSAVQRALYTKSYAIVPQIKAANRIVSPRDIRSPFKVVPLQSGIQTNVLAINSGALIQTHFLSQIGGFPDDFSLDFIDNWLFFKLDEQHLPVDVLTVTIEHELSVMSTQTISMKRYQSIIEAEYHYYHSYQKIGKMKYEWHLLLRIVSQLLIKRDVEKTKYLINFFKQTIHPKDQ